MEHISSTSDYLPVLSQLLRKTLLFTQRATTDGRLSYRRGDCTGGNSTRMPQRRTPRQVTHYSYRKIKILGRGGEGICWLCERESDKKRIVMKTYDRWVEHDGRPLELFILLYIIPNHPRINYCDGWAVLPDKQLEAYYDYCKGGDLSSFMVRHERCHESFIWHVFMQIADALALLRESSLSTFVRTDLIKKFADYGYRRDHPNLIGPHWQRVVHRDVKPPNIFLATKYVSGGAFPSLVLGDFGIATLQSTSSSGTGTPSWQGPEWPTITAKTDIWGLGAIIHALAHGHSPQRPVPRGEGRRAWERNPRSKNPQPLTSTYSRELSHVMMRCLALRPDDRINSKDLVTRLVRDRAIWNGRHRGRH